MSGSDPKPLKADKPVRTKRWWRWPLRILLSLVILAVLLRIAIHVAIPYVAEAVCQSLGLRVEFRSIKLTLLSLRVELLDVALYASDAAEGDPPLARVGRGDIIFDLGALLDTGAIRFARAELDGVDLRVDLEADRMITLWNRIGESGSPEETGADLQPAPRWAKRDSPFSPSEEQAADRLDLTLPVEIGSFRVQDLRVLFEDHRPGLEMKANLLCNLVGEELGSRTSKNHLLLTASSPNLVEAFRLEVEGIAGPGILKGDLSLHLAELEPGRMESHLRELGVWSEAKDVALEFRAKVDLEPRKGEGVGSTGSVEVEQMDLFLDNERTLGLGRLGADILTWSPHTMHVGQVSLDGLRMQAGIVEGGRPGVAGFEFLSRSPNPESDADPKVPATAEDDVPAQMATIIDEIRIADLEVAFRDATRGVTQDVGVREISISGLALGAEEPTSKIGLEASLALPGSIESWKLHGDLDPRTAIQTLGLDSTMEGVTLARLTPYLTSAGLQPELASGKLGFSVRGRIEKQRDDRTRMDLTLGDLRLEDGRDLLLLEKLEVRGWSQESGSESQSIELVELGGLGLAVDRDASDRLHLLGMRILGRGAPASSSPSDSGSETVAPRSERPVALSSKGKRFPARSADAGSMFVNRLLAHDSWVHLRDRSKRARLPEVHGRWSADIKHVLLGESARPRPSLEFDLRLSVRDLLDRLAIQGTMDQRGDRRNLVMDLDGKGISGPHLQPFLRPMGISSEFDSAELSLHAEARGLHGSHPIPDQLLLQEVRFHDSKRSLFSLPSLLVQGLAPTESGTKIDKVVIEGPALRVERDAEGAIHLAGLRLETPNAASQPKPEAGGETSKAKKSEAGPQVRPTAPSFRLGSLALTGARLQFVDHFAKRETQTPLKIDLQAKDLALDARGPALDWDLAVSVPDNLDRLRIHGALEKAHGLSLRAGVDASGIRKGNLSEYLPEGMSIGMTDGRLAGKVRLSLEGKPGDWTRADLSLESWRLNDGGQDLWHLDELVFAASRKDPKSEIYSVEQFMTKGHEIHLTRDAAKKLHAMGLILASGSASEEPAIEDPELAKARRAEANRKRFDRVRSLRAPLERLASVHLGKLSLGLDKIHFVDEADPLAVPVVGHLRIENPKPMNLLPSDLEEMPPEELRITASLTPLFKSLRLDLSAQPWDIMPELGVSLRVDGIRGEGLTEVFPDLSKKVDGKALPDGVLELDMRLALQMRRTSRTQFPLENGFGMNLELEKFEFRDRPEGRILAGLDSMEAQIRRIEPRTGKIWIRSLSADTPRVRIDRTEEGMVLGGICIRMPKTRYPEEGAEAKIETVTSSTIHTNAGSKKAPSLDRSVRIDGASMSGLDFVYRDLRASPHTVIPITGLEAEVSNFVRGPTAARLPTKFQVFIDGGLVDLPKRPESKGLIRGIVGVASDVVGGSSSSSIPKEKRPVFDELSLKGSLYTSPRLRGEANLDLTSLELLTFKSLAKRFGVVIQDGVLDLNTKVEIGGDEQMEVGVYPVFTFLSLSEPKNGFLSSLLALPAPLDTTLFLTRNSYGEHVYPFSFRLDRGSVSAGQIRSIIIGAFSRSLATMVTNSPFRILGGVTSLLGLDISSRNTEVGEPVQLTFDRGQVTLNTKQKEQIRKLMTSLEGDDNLDLRVMHRGGLDDWVYAERIANPSRAQCIAMGKGMIQKERELRRERSLLAKNLVSLYENGRVEDARRGGRDLRRLDRELGELQQSMDKLLEHLRPGAERQKGRRTKLANQEIAKKRIDSVVEELVRVGGEAFRDRIETLRPRSRRDESLKKGEVVLVQRRRVGR